MNGYPLEGEGYGYVVDVEGGEFILNGTITNCHVNAVVYVNKDGTFRMGDKSAITHIGYGKFLSHQTDHYYNRLGVVLEKGTYIMDGGTISDCLSQNTYRDAGISNARGGCGVYVGKACTFIMNGGEITGNRMFPLDSGEGNGGGVYVDSADSTNFISGTFIMNGGTISNNTVNGLGSGVYVAGEYATFKMNGTARIAGDNDVYLKKRPASNGNITALSSLTGGAMNITVGDPENGTLVVKDGAYHLRQFGLSSLMKDKFGLEKNGNDLRLRYITNITLNSNQGTGESPASVIASLNSENLYSDYHLDPPISIINPTRPGYTFGGWYNESGGVGVCVIGTDGKLKPSTSRYTDDSGRWTYSLHTLTLYANWTANTTKITLDPNGGAGGTSSTVNATYDSSVLDSAITKPTRPGHTFCGWNSQQTGGVCVINASGVLEQNVVGYTNSTGKWNNDTREITLYANWTANTTTVTLDKNGGGDDGSATAIYDCSTITVTHANKSGYTVEGYYTTATGGDKVITAGGSLVSDTVTGWVDNGRWANDTLTATLYANWTQTTYRVTYDDNGATGGDVPVDPNSPYATGAIVTVLAPVNLVKGGEYFHGWTMDQAGSGTLYCAGDRFTITTDTTLYAKWNTTAPVNCRVTYHGNGNTSGTVPVDPNSPYGYNAEVVVLGNIGNLVNTTGGTNYFYGWKTMPDNSGTFYHVGGIFTITTDTVLFANWSSTAPTGYRVTYHGNGHDTGTVPVDGNSPYTLGTDVTVLGNTGNLVKTGYDFSGWNELPDGSGISYAVGGPISNIQRDYALFANWTPISAPATYTVTVQGDGHGTCSASCGATAAPGDTVTLTASPNPGYHFKQWRVAFGGVSITGNTFTMPAANVKVIGQFETNGDTSGGNTDYSYRVLFETFGGSFISPVTGLSAGDVITEPPAPTKKGYTFGGWYTDEDCTKKWNFADGIPGDMTLYARWIGGTTPTPAATTGQPTTTPSVPVTAEPTGEPTGDTTISPSGDATGNVPPAGTGDDGSSGNSTFYFLLFLLFLLVLALIVYYLYRRYT